MAARRSPPAWPARPLHHAEPTPARPTPVPQSPASAAAAAANGRALSGGQGESSRASPYPIREGVRRSRRRLPPPSLCPLQTYQPPGRYGYGSRHPPRGRRRRGRRRRAPHPAATPSPQRRASRRARDDGGVWATAQRSRPPPPVSPPRHHTRRVPAQPLIPPRRHCPPLPPLQAPLSHSPLPPMRWRRCPPACFCALLLPFPPSSPNLSESVRPCTSDRAG